MQSAIQFRGSAIVKVRIGGRKKEVIGKHAGQGGSNGLLQSYTSRQTQDQYQIRESGGSAVHADYLEINGRHDGNPGERARNPESAAAKLSMADRHLNRSPWPPDSV
jgi:hypothetical protein